MGSVEKDILIIGGGLGGLCLAQGLKRAGVPFRVYERDADASWRPQGYRLRINGEGVNALKETLSPELWERFENTCCTAELGETDINAVDGTIIASRAGGSPAMKGLKPYTCDRKVLRDILLDGLEDKVSYGKEMDRYELVTGGVVAYFKDGTTAIGRFLVGADGRGSPTRRQYLAEHRPLDTEGMCIYGKTLITPELLERFPARAMRWMTLIVDRTPITQTLDVDDTAVTLLLEPIRFPKKNGFDEYMPADYMYWVLIARKHIFNLPADVSLSKYSSAEVADISLRVTECWDPSIRSILHLQDKTQSSLLRVLSASPDMKPWAPTDKVTIIGDAIHAMSPCGGVGAVTALVDGANLAKTIVNQGITAESIGAFEQSMREFSGANIRRSYIGGRKLFGQRPFEECAEYQG
ncbi:cercosporin toxin biosynthesis protein [Echria macrotheca]|uniref:Cercosporin toxin biosynthesis protein n=1 Tax=Echria macrotheca TaxID=438768 RepID=A0AAJ0B5A4_9PEZI|nr:cercosporin toxin biosynthesis protein [Echria macrotheca]